MADSYGSGVSRTLSALWRQFGAVVWQEEKPPLDSELNLMAQIDWDRIAMMVRTMVPSGFFMDPTRALNDYQFDQSWSNFFVLGNPRTDSPYDTHDADEENPPVWANVNGWVLPIAGTETATSLENLVKLYPPPASDSRVDFVFLEAWQTLVAPNPSSTNKPDVDKIWKYGNVLFGGTNIDDDLEDPEIGFETTERVQVQYRLRVFGQGVGLGSGVALDVYPDGLDDPNVLGQGAATSPVGGYTFTNMREKLGDPGLWRAGDGSATAQDDLGTVDGYTYAIPVAAIFRRNSGVYVSVSDAGTANQNGAFLRTPNTSGLPDPLTGARVLLDATLGTDLAYDDENLVVDITNLNGSGLEDTDHDPSVVFLVVDGEIISISNIDVINEQVTIPASTATVPARGRYGTNASAHATGASVQFWNSRPDGKFSDEIAETDLLDLRRAINPGDWDYQRLLLHNVAALSRGNLRTAWKQSGAGGTEGVVIHEVDYLSADGTTAVPNGTEALDGPDGIRMVWSDAAVQQPDVTLLLDTDATLVNGAIGFSTSDQFDTTVEWDVGADFYPIGFMNLGGVFSAQSWTNGSSIHLFIGGEAGETGARGTFRDGTERQVRFVTPMEYFRSSSPDVDSGNQYPMSLRFIGEKGLEAAPEHAATSVDGPYPGPQYPWEGADFEKPFIALGQVLHTGLKKTVAVSGFGGDAGIQVGLVTVGAGSMSVVGSNSCRFQDDTKAGDIILIDGALHMVRSVESRTALTLTSPHVAGAAGVNWYRVYRVTLEVGIDFSVAGTWWQKDANGNFLNDPDQVTNPLLNGRRTLYGMLTKDGEDPSGLSSEVYVVLWGDQDSVGNNGIFKVIGAGNDTVGLTRNFTDAPNPGTGSNTAITMIPLSADWTGYDDATGNDVDIEFRSQYHLAELGGSYAGLTADLVIGLTDIGGDAAGSPWDRDTMARQDPDPDYDINLPRDGATDKVAVTSKLLLSLSLLYHPGRGGMARVPDEVTRVSLRDANATYLRQNKVTIDTTFPNVPDDETIYDPNHVQLWNRLPALGWHAPTAPNYGGNIVGYTEQDREHELFFDKGSKSLLFRPFRDRQMTLHAMTYTDYAVVDDSLIGEYDYPDTSPKDDLQLYTRTGADPSTGKRMGIPVPREFMPRFGRQDIPYFVDTASGAGTFLSGINHLFRDTTDLTSPVFNIIGGRDNTTGGNQVTSMYLRTDTPTNYGKAVTVSTPFGVVAAYDARKTTDINTAQPYAQAIVDALREVNSSDFGKGLKGIQMPPYMGIARLYGVYDLRDFVSKGGRTFQSDRITLETDPAPNLLKTDADQQTLFILQDGAKDLTTEDHDHTYIIPSEALDISKALNYVDGDVFEDYDYVVECVVFGFARGFINYSNHVLVRIHGGNGVGVGGSVNADGDDFELEGVHMVIPSAASFNDCLFVASNRTVYQGDPYMTRNRTSRVTSDYEFRYGRPATSELYELATPIQQYLSSGAFVPETPNARAFEVLSSVDFYTTLGTGTVGGDLHPGTFMDVGFLENTSDTGAPLRLPLSASDPPWGVLTRTFTEGQKNNPSRAEAIVRIADATLLNENAYKFARLWITDLDGTKTQLVFSKLEYVADAKTTFAGTEDQDIITVASGGLEGHQEVMTIAWDGAGATTFYPGQSYTQTPGSFDYFGAEVGDLVRVYPKDFDIADVFNATDSGLTVLFEGFVDSTGTVELRATATGTRNNIGTNTFAGGTIAPGVTSTCVITITGAATGDFVVWGFESSISGLTGPETAQVNAYVSAADTVTIQITNPSTATGNADWPAGTFWAAIVQDQDSSSWSITIPEADYYVSVIKFKVDVSETVSNMVWTINNHPDLQTSVKAYQISSEEAVLQAVAPGVEGNGLHAEATSWDWSLDAIHVRPPSGDHYQEAGAISFSGGADIRVNAGDGTTQLRLTGMTERLPLGILLQDSDFLGENILGDTATSMKTSPAGLRPVQTVLPLTTGGEEFTRFMGAPGDLVGMADGSILEYTGYNETTAPSGATSFRLYRGGGSAFVLSGDAPGGPVDWVSETFSGPLQPILKGGALVCRAMLVRNFYEEAFSTAYKVSDSDEIQMVVITYGVFGDESTRENGLELSGLISPSGYGEGYAAADRYRIDGRPMFKGFSRVTPRPEEVVLAPLPDTGGS